MKWQQVEPETCRSWPIYLDPGDLCYFARVYKAQGGYLAGHGNSDVQNLKKPMSKQGTPEFYYKNKAILKFVKELGYLHLENYYISAMLGSKTTDDPEYDSRLDVTLVRLARIIPTIKIVSPFTLTRSYEPYHKGGQPRYPIDIYRLLEWNGLPEHVQHLIIIDDVLTTGAHFKACKMLLSEYSPLTRLIGVFWTKTDI